MRDEFLVFGHHTNAIAQNLVNLEMLGNVTKMNSWWSFSSC